MSFDNSKYDVEFGGVGLRIQNYRKSETATFIPRLGTGDQSSSEFDILKSREIEDFGGGMLQREWVDDHSFFGSENLVPIYDDGVLYPVLATTTSTAIDGAKHTITAQCQTKDYLFLAINHYSGSAYNYIVRIDSSGTQTTMTIPVAARDDNFPIRSLVIWNNQVWASQGQSRLFWADVAGTTFTLLSGTWTGDRLVVYQGSLYGTHAASAQVNVNLWKYTGDTTTATATMVGSVGSNVPDYNADLLVYNGRIILTRTDGLYAYDGIRLAPVDESKKDVNIRNYRFLQVLKGYLYYWMTDGMYRYNGSLVEKLYDISEVGFPVAVTTAKNRLWIAYSNSALGGSSRYDKSMGYDYSSGTSINGRVAIFNGKAMYTYARTSNDGKPGSPDMADQGENNGIAWFNDTLYVFTNYSKTTLGLHFRANTNELAATGTAAWKLITSIFDADFPMINKTLENFEIVLDGDASSDETVTLEYRTSGFSGSSGWTTIGTFKTQSKLQEFVHRSLPNGVLFKKIQFRLSGTTTLGYGFRKFIVRYLLVPDFKWQWNFTINAFGDNPLEPLLLKDGTQSVQKVSELRGKLYEARSSGIPVGFADIDQLDLAGAHNNSVTTLTLNTTALLKPFGFVKIDDEVIRYAAKTTTTLTGCERGSLGTAAATHNDNSAVFPYYRALVRQLQNELIEMDDSDLDRQEDMSKPSQIAIILQEV